MELALALPRRINRLRHRIWRAGVLLAQLRCADYERDDRRHRAWRAVRGRCPARPDCGRSVPSGEVGRGRTSDPAQLRGARALVLSKRIIACLDVRDGQVVKGVNFEGLRGAGDPAALARRYNAEGIDELVILDITATLERRRALADTILAVARELFIPLAVGGRSEER